MRLNENTVISTRSVLLVPYEAHHVPRYHAWMEDEAIREATASERLTLAEEHENQGSWRQARDRLTFIVCKPLLSSSSETTAESAGSDGQRKGDSSTGSGGDRGDGAVRAGHDDASARMLGDVNLFLTLCDDPDSDSDDTFSSSSCAAEGADHTAVIAHHARQGRAKSNDDLVAEIDIMIAAPLDRRRGHGRAAVRALLRYVVLHRRALVEEYYAASTTAAAAACCGPPGLGSGMETETGGEREQDHEQGIGQEEENEQKEKEKEKEKERAEIRELVVRVKAGNEGSIALFQGLGFEGKGEVNYFGEVEMRFGGFGERGGEAFAGDEGDGYCEVDYDRSGIEK